jgi:hypothetical protein
MKFFCSLGSEKNKKNYVMQFLGVRRWEDMVGAALKAL